MAISRQRAQRLWKIQERQTREAYKKWKRIWEKYYLAQGKIIADNHRSVNLTNLIFKVEDIKKIYQDMYADVGTSSALISYMTAKHRDLSFTVKRDEYAEAQIRPYEQAMRDYAMSDAGLAVVSISETGRSAAVKIIQKLTAEAIEQGYGVNELTDYLEDNIPVEWRRIGKFNAERIARTEVIGAAGHGSFLGAKATGRPMIKIWLTAVDGRERDAHRHANRQERDLDEPFDVGGEKMMHNLSKGASARNVINCRCKVHYQTVLFPNRNR